MKLVKTFIGLWCSRKLWMAIFANVTIWAAYERAIAHLYAMPDGKVAAFVAITQTVMYSITAISAAYVGVQGFIQMRQGVTSAVMQATEEVIKRVPKASHFDGDDIP